MPSQCTTIMQPHTILGFWAVLIPTALTLFSLSTLTSSHCMLEGVIISITHTITIIVAGIDHTTSLSPMSLIESFLLGISGPLGKEQERCRLISQNANLFAQGVHVLILHERVVDLLGATAWLPQQGFHWDWVPYRLSFFVLQSMMLCWLMSTGVLAGSSCQWAKGLAALIPLVPPWACLGGLNGLTLVSENWCYCKWLYYSFIQLTVLGAYHTPGNLVPGI